MCPSTTQVPLCLSAMSTDVTSKPARPLLLMDGITFEPVKPSPSSRRLRRALCVTLVTLGIVVVVAVLVMVILRFTVFKPRKPVITVGAVSLADLNVSVGSGLQVNINASLDVNLSVRNPNRVGFKYNDASALLNYNGNLVGEAPIPAGRIGARKTVEMNITLSLMADRLVSDPKLYTDVISGSLPLNTYARIAGKVSILFVKINVVSYTNCNMTVDITSRTLKDNVCKYETKL